MRTTFLALAATVLVCAPAAHAERLTDKQLTSLIETIASEEDRFRDALDPNLKRAVIKNASGEYDVERILKDFSDAAERLEDRFKKDYSASTEAADLLRQATTIDNYFHRDQAATKGESEWNGFAARLKVLAAAYGTAFPLAPGASTRRISDRELTATCDGLARDADQLKKVVDKGLKQDKTVPKETREGVVREIDLIKKDAGALKSAVGDGKAASAEATQLLARLSKVNGQLATTPVPAATTATASMGAKAGLVAQAFGVPAPVASPR
jgi:hypothetical protein